MRQVSWPLASMVIVTVIVIGVVAIVDGDIAAVSSAIFTLLLALGLAELRDIKSQTNGSQNTLLEQNRALMAELSQYRRDASRITDRALESAPLVAPVSPAATPDNTSGPTPWSTSTTTTTTDTHY